MVAEYYIYF